MVRNVCFTWNNPPETAEATLRAWKPMTYCCFGREKGESETPHLQGYAELRSDHSWDKVHRALPGVHVEARKGTQQQATAYCKKDGDWVEWGTPKESAQGKRTDLQKVADLVKSGAPVKRVAEEYPDTFIKFHKGIIALKMILIQPRDSPPNVTVLHGATETGKSRKAREICSNAWVWHPQSEKWFDGYEGQDNVIFEEFRGQLPFGMLLSLLDRYDCRVQYKGGSCEFRAINICITSPLPPTKWYNPEDLRADEKLDQLLRRITKVESLDAQKRCESFFNV